MTTFFVTAKNTTPAEFAAEGTTFIDVAVWGSESCSTLTYRFGISEYGMFARLIVEPSLLGPLEGHLVTLQQETDGSERVVSKTDGSGLKHYFPYAIFPFTGKRRQQESVNFFVQAARSFEKITGQRMLEFFLDTPEAFPQKLEEAFMDATNYIDKHSKIAKAKRLRAKAL